VISCTEKWLLEALINSRSTGREAGGLLGSNKVKKLEHGDLGSFVFQEDETPPRPRLPVLLVIVRSSPVKLDFAPQICEHFNLRV